MWNRYKVKELEKFGININQNDDKISEDILEKLSLYSSVAEFTEQDFFKRELKRIQLPTN